MVKVLSLDDLAAITSAVSLKVFEIHENEERIYRAYPARPVFDKVFGKGWEAAQEIVFTSIDGYQLSIPVAKFLAHDAYFAFAHEDRTPFSMANTLQNNEIVKLGPLYLVWDNTNSKTLLEAGSADMPWQIMRIALKFVAPFPNTSPRAKKSEEAGGFMHSRKHCMTCHTIWRSAPQSIGTQLPDKRGRIYQTSVPEALDRASQKHPAQHNTALLGLAKEIPQRGKSQKDSWHI
ncbi:MAG: cytochrome c [Pseudomonadota bacterium]|nr:cytochrome c [Pseudomonadota bacterium]